MIRRTVKIQLVAFVVITVLGILYAGFSLIGVEAVNRPYTVKVDFASSGGIFTGAEVTYRGVRVGQVGQMHLTRDGVVADLKIDKDVRIPSSGTKAVVANKSAVGEQYVDLRPPTSGAPFFRDGDSILRSNTQLPVEISQVLLDLDRMVNSVDRENLQALVEGLGDAFRGTGPAITQLIESGNEFTLALESVLPQTFQLIDEGRTVLDTARATSSQFRTFAQGLATLTDTLRTSDPDIRRLLDNGVQAARELDGLIEPNQQAIAVLLGDLVTINRIGVARLNGTRQTLVALPELVRRVPMALIDGQLHNGLVIHDHPVACNYQTEERLPRERTAKAPDTTRNCNPAEGGKRTSCWAPPPATEMQRCAAQPAPSSEPYDLMGLGTGAGPLTLSSEGGLATVGWEGGQAAVLGESSWLAMLLAPLQ
ncbi:MAG TPA: MlaD family protein [Frankiaceae bacterium]|nr:MlaD family protein [Frankiaceae bacterium]